MIQKRVSASSQLSTHSLLLPPLSVLPQTVEKHTHTHIPPHHAKSRLLHPLLDYLLPIPSHHARSFSLRCGIFSLISVSPPSKLALLARLLLLFALSIIALLLLGPLSSAGNVLLGLNVSLLPFLGLGLARSLDPNSPSCGLGARLDFFVDAVAGGRL